ncbi:MAG: hypothetical protein R2910_04660 [Gemmatimonadales bacterium]
MNCRALVVALGILGPLGGASPLTAQEKAIELTAGILGLGYTTCNGCNGVFELATGGANDGIFTGFGGGSVALGVYLSPEVAIEPTIAASVLSSGGETATILSLGVAVPYYFDKGWGRKGGYFAPKVTVNHASGGGQSSDQFAIGVGVGTKLALNDAAALRLQASFDYGFEGDFSATTSFGAFFGLSVFLK